MKAIERPPCAASWYHCLQVHLAVALLVGGLPYAGGARAGSVSVPVTAMWDFDGLNPLEDVTGNGHDLIDPLGTSTPGFFVTPTPSANGWDPNGLKGRAVVFDGDNDYLDIPNSVYSGGDFTLMVAEMRPNTDTTYDTIAASTGFRFQDVDSELTGGVRQTSKGGPGGTFGGVYPHAVNDWHLVTLRYNATSRELETFSTTNSTTLSPAKLTGSVNAPGFTSATVELADFRLGMDGVSTIGGNDAWAGQLDFAIFHDGLLSNAQLDTIANEFNNSPNVLPPQLPPPVPTARWDFNGSDPLADRTGNGHDLLNPGGGNSPTFTAPLSSSNGWQPAEFVRGAVAQFDGNDWLDIPNDVYEGGDFTVVVAHRRPASAGGYDTIFANSRFRFQDVNNTLAGSINSPGGNFGTPYPLTPDDWYFTVLRYDDAMRTLNSFTVTDDDVLGPPVMTGNAVTPGLGNAVDWRLGYNNSGIGSPDTWVGQLDFVVFYNEFVINERLELVFEQFNVPEPATATLLLVGLLALSTRRRRSRTTGS